MSFTAALVHLILYVCITTFGSRLFFYLYLHVFTKRKLAQLGSSLEQLKYSYEEIIYIIPVPNFNPLISQAPKSAYQIKKEFSSLLYPSVKGIMIYIKNDQVGDQLVAYLPFEKFRPPLLDKFLIDKKINNEIYTKISSYKLMHPSTLIEIKDEIYNQFHKRDFYEES